MIGEKILDRETVMDAAERLTPGSKAYKISTPAGQILLAADRRLAAAAMIAVVDLLDKVEGEDRRIRYTDIEDTIARAFNGARDAFESEMDAPETRSPVTHSHAVALRLEADRTEPYMVSFDLEQEVRHKFVHDRRSRRQLLDEAARIEEELHRSDSERFRRRQQEQLGAE